MMYKELPTSGSFSSGINAEINSCIVRLHEDYSLHGLELYLYTTRVMNNIFMGKAMIKYQNALNTYLSMAENDKICNMADVCTKLSKWSQELALKTTCLDLIRLY